MKNTNQIAWGKNEYGYASKCNRFTITKSSVAGFRSGCWKTCYHLHDQSAKFSEKFIDTLGEAKEIARQVIEDGE
jgi:hypothetical protein